MSKLEPYISLDLETSGVDISKAQILQIAMIYDDFTQTKISDMPSLLINIQYRELSHATLEALEINKNLITQILDKDDPVKKRNCSEAMDLVSAFLCKYSNKNGGKITIAGKNAASFDIPILDNHLDNKIGLYIKRRSIDVGSLYYPDFGYVPTLSEVNKLTQRSEVKHNAYDDASDVIFAIRKKLILSVEE